jgi:class 3 adenylate cyclase
MPHQPTPHQPTLRLVAVAFCDLVGSTATMASLPAERWGQALDRYYHLVGAELSDGGGRLEKFIGDAVVAVAGVDGDTDPDPEALVRAMVRAVDAVGADRRLKAIVPGGLKARAAVVSGRVLIDLSRDSTFAVGRVMHRAARLQGAAPAGAVVIDLVTRLLLRDRVPTAPLPPRLLAGFAKPVPLFRVGPADGENRPGIVDRVSELGVLLGQVGARLELAASGWILVSGPAGIGKTRLIEELLEALRPRGAQVALVPCRVSGAQEFTLILELIAAVDPGDRSPVAGPGVMRVDLLAHLRRAAEAAVGTGGLVVVLDDVHGLTGFEAGSLREALLSLPAEVAVVLAGRSVPAVLAGSVSAGVQVGKLSDVQLHELWDGVVGDVVLHGTARWQQDAVHRSAGNPLFLKELALLAGGDEPSNSALPPSAELVIEHLLRRLSAAAVELVSVVAVTGGVLPTDDFVQIFGTAGDVDSIVLEATDVGLLVITPTGLAHESRLQTEVLHGRLPLARRARLHTRVAVALGNRLAGRPQLIEQIAHHRTAAADAWDEFDPESAEAGQAGQNAAETLVRLAGFVAGRGDRDRADRLLDEAGRRCPTNPSLTATIAALRSAVVLAGGDAAGAESLALEAAGQAGDAGPAERAHLAARQARARIVAGLPVQAGLRSAIHQATHDVSDENVLVACLLVEGHLAAIDGDYRTAQVCLSRGLGQLRSVLSGIDGPEIYANLGLFLLLGDTPAEPAAEVCQSMALELRDAELLRAALSCPYALLEDAAGRSLAAANLLDRAEELFAALGHEFGRHAVRDFRIDLLIRHGRMLEAAELLRLALLDYRAMGLSRESTRAGLMLAILHGSGPAPERTEVAEPGDWMTEALGCLVRAGDDVVAPLDRAAAVVATLAVMDRIGGAGARIIPLVLGCWLVHTGRIQDGAGLTRAGGEAARIKGDVVVRATLSEWEQRG